MSFVSSSNPPRHPNLIFVAPAPGWLDVVACHAAGRAMQVVWQARQPLHEQAAPAALASRLAEILRQHALPAQTRAVLIVPPGTGGLLASPALDDICRDAAWCRRQLELAVPYPPAEIRYGVRCGDGLAQFFWLPKTWLDSQKAQLQKLGLNLTEVYPRAALFETGHTSPNFDGVLCEKAEQGESLYDFHNGRVRQAAQLPAGIDAAARQACLGGMRAAGGGAAAVPEAAAALPAWADCLPALWQDTGLAIPADDSAAALWSPFYRLALLLAVAFTVLATALSWAIAAKESALSQAVREKKKLAQAAQRFQELDRSLREEGAIVAALAQMNDAPTPLPLLAQVTQVLPQKAWVQQMAYDGKAIVIAGKGIGDDELIGLLQGAQLDVEKTRQEPIPETNDFRLRVLRKPAAPAQPAGGGAS